MRMGSWWSRQSRYQVAMPVPGWMRSTSQACQSGVLQEMDRF
jgi:hypothetical protein